MSVTASQVFVRTGRPGRVLRELEAYLGRWAKSVRDEWPDVPFLGTRASRSTCVIAPVEGWCCLLDADLYHVDLDLAEWLSGALSTTAVATEIRGGELVFRHAAYERGVLAREEREPPEAFSAAAGSGDVAMPLYQDPVREMVRVLRSEGIPADLWFLRQDALAPADSDGGHSMEVDEVVTEPEKKRAVTRLPRRQVRPGHAPGTVPFRPDVEGPGPDGRLTYAEIRTLFGRPSHQAVECLLEIERADRNRLHDADLGAEGEPLPEIHFEYTVRGGADEGLARLLDLRREEYFRSRPAKSAFLDAALEIVRTERGAWSNARASGFGLRVELGRSGREQAIDLDQPYSDYMEGRLAATSPEEALRAFLDHAASDLDAAGEAASEFDSVSSLLVPCLVLRAEAARLGADGVASRDVGHGVSVVVACRVGDGSALIDSGDLAGWGVSFNEALGAARSNLLSQARETAKPPLPVEIAAGRKALAFLSGGQSSGHMLMPGFSAVMREVLGVDETLCAIPDQDSLFVVGAGDPEAASALRAFARERLLAADHPLTAELFRLKGDEIVEA